MPRKGASDWTPRSDHSPSHQGYRSNSASPRDSGESDSEPEIKPEYKSLIFPDVIKLPQEREGRQSEAEIVTSAIKSALDAARGSSVEWPQSSIPEFPDALPESRFLKPTPSFSLKKVPKQVVQHKALPPASLAPLRDDLSIAPQGQPARMTVSVANGNISQCEEMLRRALEACSIMDAFLGGMFTARDTEFSHELHSEGTPQLSYEERHSSH